MANLAIKGHTTRGKEVIEILEMLGGNNTTYDLDGSDENAYYYIHHGYIDADHKDMIGEPHPEFKHYTLEKFLEKFPYKVGDKVKVKKTGKDVTIDGMSWRNGCEVIYDTCYNNDCVAFYSAEELQPYKEETMESKPNLLQQLIEYFDNTPRDVLEKEWYEYDKYNEIGPKVNEYLEYVNKSRQPKYPKTYEECCDVLKIEYPYFKTEEDGISASTYKNKLFGALKQLLICRDAYWKMECDWKPDWTKADERKYCIVNTEGGITKWVQKTTNKILAFPTSEMRGAFYENFKDLIGQCKELL